MSTHPLNVIHRREMREGDVYIGRGGPWGNPFRIGQDGSRADVIHKHKQWLWEQLQRDEALRAALLALDSKRLACWCAPRPCHGDTLIAAIEWLKTVGGQS